jgi:acetyl esterase/lipase
MQNNPMYLTRSQLYKPEKHVMVRILSPIEFPVDWKNRMIKHDMIEEVNKKKNGVAEESFLSSFSKRSTTFQQQPTGFFQWWCLPPFSANVNEPKRTKTNKEIDNFIEIDAIMIHIHGGGFVAMSSASHQNYTRKWANEIGIPIFSIDYRLAPEYPYPAALNDVWQAYYWIITHCETHLGIKPKKVFISGDSAGGNLTLALTMLSIEKEFRVPDFVLPSYPALNLSLRNFSPSLMLSLDDFILPSSFLMLCLESYVKDACPEKDHFLSPGICPDHVLKRFPPIRILIAGNDPLRDESYKFTMKLLKNKVDVKVFEFICFPHGFLSFELPLGGIDEWVKWNEQAIKYFKEFLPKHEEGLQDALIKIEKKKSLSLQKELNPPIEQNVDEEEQEGSGDPNIDTKSPEKA